MPITSFTISGTISGDVVSGVTVTLTANGTYTGGTNPQTTGGGGTYSFGGISAGNFSGAGVTITPTDSGYVFSPASRNYTTPATSSGQNFTSYSTPLPTSISPTRAPQGATLNVTVSGTEFGGVATSPTLSFSGSGITVNSYTTQNSTTVTANITISGGATVGARDVIITNGPTSGTLSGAFTIVDYGQQAGAFLVGI